MIQAKVVADSIGPNEDRLTALEIMFPRYILAELNTHRMFSKNSASSRAIPFEKMIKEVQENPFIPIAWQKDHKGMQGTKYITDENDIWESKALWLRARDKAVLEAKELNRVGVTKQLVNRLLEPFMYHKVLVSGTEWENFFNLRCPQYGNEEHGYYRSRKEAIEYLDNRGTNTQFLAPQDTIEWLKVNKGQADIHMMFLAEAIYDAMNESEPTKLKEGEWHIPYSDNIDVSACLRLAIANSIVETKEFVSDYTKEEIDLVWKEFAPKIAIARCARLSYQTLGDNPEINYEKDLELYEVLAKSGHYSPFEHVARVMTREEYHTNLKGKVGYEEGEGYTIFEENVGWCRNFRGFIQYRELLDN